MSRDAVAFWAGVGTTLGVGLGLVTIRAAWRRSRAARPKFRRGLGKPRARRIPVR